MLKATTAASVSLDSLSQRMSAGNFLVFAVFQLSHFLHVFLLGHTLTGSKFLLLFSIKSKEEILCFAAKVPNGRTPHVCQAIFLCFCALFSVAPAPLYICRFRHCGEGFGKGNPVSLSSSAGVRDPLQQVRPDKKPCILKCRKLRLLRQFPLTA